MIDFRPLNGSLFSALALVCQTKSTTSQVHDWVVYKLGTLLGSVGNRVKMHKSTPATGKERGDIKLKDYVVMKTIKSQDNRLPPPRNPDNGLYHDPYKVWSLLLVLLATCETQCGPFFWI